MNYALFFWISLAFMFCFGLATEIIRHRINVIMKAANPLFTGKPNSSRDLIRVLQAYHKNIVTKPNERTALLFYILMYAFSLIGLIMLIIVIVFGPGLMEILNPQN